jgi:hypothetical protein
VRQVPAEFDVRPGDVLVQMQPRDDAVRRPVRNAMLSGGQHVLPAGLLHERVLPDLPLDDRPTCGR